MRLIAVIFVLSILAGTVFAECGCAAAKAVDVGSSIGVGPDGDGKGTGGGNMSAVQNQTKKQEGNQTMVQAQNQTGNMTQAMNKTQDQEKNKTMDSKGISIQVKQIIEERKNGSITVPQGMVVRIIARNRTMTVEQAMMQINETIRANVKVQGKNRTLTIEPDDETVNITDENVTVTTDETIEIVNDTLSVGGKKVLVMPSAVPEKIKAKTIKSAVLHVANGDPVYQVNATRKAKVLWVFDAEMDVETTLDANTGKVKDEKGPWWSFLASVEEE